jgi:hypothetical protein
MKKDPRKLERILMFVVALALTPMLLYTAFLTVHSVREGGIYRNAQIIEGPAEREYGGFYQVRGLVSGGLLNPEAFPEIKNALQTTVTRETRDPATGTWKPADKKPEWTQATDIVVGTQPVKISVASRLIIDQTSQTAERSDNERFRIEQQSVGPGDYVVFGMYADGKLQDGHHERLIIAPSYQLDDVLALVDRAGKKKAMILAILSAVIATLIGVTLRAAVKGSPKQACCS